MTRHTRSGIVVGVAVVMMGLPGRMTAQQTAAQTKAAKAAATANPELIGSLSKEMGSTPEQAAGAAGSIFSLAKSRLKADEFADVSKSVPGMTSMLGAAPSGGGGGIGGAMSKVTGGGGGLGPVTAAFSKLGLKPEMVSLALPVVSNYVTKKGGSKLGGLLANVLK